jgi:hypothetical protein
VDVGFKDANTGFVWLQPVRLSRAKRKIKRFFMHGF